MAWSRRWRIDSAEKWRTILRALIDMGMDLKRHPVELIVREERVEKTHEQRKLFHAVCSDLAPHFALSPGGMKLKVKASFYGVEIRDEDGVYYAVVPSSEDSDREEYSRLIDHAYQMGAEQGVVVQDRRPH